MIYNEGGICCRYNKLSGNGDYVHMICTK